MFQRLLPDYMFPTYRDITPEFLRGIGVSALLIDIDNTLAPYEMPDPDDDIRLWFARLSESGIRAALVSNNHAPRVTRFNETLGLPAFSDSGKPGKKRLSEALAAVGGTPETTAVIGDQLLTDAAFGKSHGMRAIIVPPIYDKRNLFFRTKRLLEIPVVRKYNKLHGTSFSTFRLPPKRDWS
ncbi:MAG: YqeG family HAD IIIA-type phosphatase [Clostridia bacterium]|nr:YqeG family HAD IIIA-type phosphatase [Clostridia bacterium]